MPLNALTMTNAVLKLTDQTVPGFVGFPTDDATTAANWADAAKDFFDELVTPLVIPGTQAAGRDAFAAAMEGLLAVPQGGAAALDAGFVAFAGVIALGVAPVPAGVTVPPAGGPAIGLLLASFIAIPVSDPNLPAAEMGSGILAWAETGTFTPAAPPGAPPVFWS